MLLGFVTAVLFAFFAWKPFWGNPMADSPFYGEIFRRDFLEICGMGVVFLIFMFLAFLAGALVAFLIGLCLPTKSVKGGKISLVSLRGGPGVAGGSFFLGTGSVGTTLHYFYYEACGEGYRPQTLAVRDNVTVFEEDRTDGELTWYVDEFTSQWWNWFAICFSDNRYEFRIPNGSLDKKFAL